MMTEVFSGEGKQKKGHPTPFFYSVAANKLTMTAVS
jgi:hypothetical protein